MNRQTKEIMMDITAEVVVSPLTLYVKLKELKDEFDASTVGAQANAKIYSTKKKAKCAAKTAYQNARAGAKDAAAGLKNKMNGLSGEEEIFVEGTGCDEAAAAEGSDETICEECPAEEPEAPKE